MAYLRGTHCRSQWLGRCSYAFVSSASSTSAPQSPSSGQCSPRPTSGLRAGPCSRNRKHAKHRSIGAFPIGRAAGRASCHSGLAQSAQPSSNGEGLPLRIFLDSGIHAPFDSGPELHVNQQLLWMRRFFGCNIEAQIVCGGPARALREGHSE